MPDSGGHHAKRKDRKGGETAHLIEDKTRVLSVVHDESEVKTDPASEDF